MNKSKDGSDERLGELGRILAAALSRMNARKSSQEAALLGESSLHISLDQSSHRIGAI
jgi:hypothetical protein